MTLRNKKGLEESFRCSRIWSHPIYFFLSLALAIYAWYLLDSLVNIESNDTSATVASSDIFLPSHRTNLNNMVEYVHESFLLQVLPFWQPWPHCVIIREQKKWSLVLKK